MAKKEPDEILKAQKFINECKQEAARNAKLFKTISFCTLLGMFSVGIINILFQSTQFIVLLMGVATIIFGFLPNVLTFFGFLKRFKNKLIAKSLTEKLLLEYRLKDGDFENLDKTKALGTFAKKFQEIKSNLENSEIEIIEDTNQLINK